MLEGQVRRSACRLAINPARLTARTGRCCSISRPAIFCGRCFQCMLHGVSGPTRQPTSTTIRGFRSVVFSCLIVFISTARVFNNEDFSRRRCAQTPAEEQDKSSNFASSNSGRLDCTQSRNISQGQTGFDGAPLQQYISDGLVSVPLVLHVQAVAEKGHFVLPDMWWTGRRRRHNLHGGGYTAALAIYGHLDRFVPFYASPLLRMSFVLNVCDNW